MRKKQDKNKPGWAKFVGKETKIKISFIAFAVALCAILIIAAVATSLGGTTAIFRPCGKVVIASESKNVDGLVSATFERCRFFIIYNLATKKYKAIANPYFSESNLGDKAAQFITNRAEEAVISGNIGPLAYQTLENSNVHVYLVSKMSVRSAVKKFLEGKLVHIESRNLFGYTDFSVQPAQQAIGGQQIAFTSPLVGANGSRTAVCPLCRLRMPLGAHIQTHRIMCPNCPHQRMQIIGAAGNYPMQQQGQMQGQGQRIGFIPGNVFNQNMPGRGICVLK